MRDFDPVRAVGWLRLATGAALVVAPGLTTRGAVAARTVTRLGPVFCSTTGVSLTSSVAMQADLAARSGGRTRSGARDVTTAKLAASPRPCPRGPAARRRPVTRCCDDLGPASLVEHDDQERRR